MEDLSELELYHFDSDESCASDYVDESEEEEVMDEVPIKIPPMFLPVDVMKEIMYYCDMNTYIRLHYINKTFKKFCDNALWCRKMKMPCYTNHEGWIQLYKTQLSNLALNVVVERFVDQFRRAPDVCNYVNSYIIQIKLEKSISKRDYAAMINQVTDNVTGDQSVLRVTLYNIVNPTKFLLRTFGYELNYTQCKELFFQLFDHGYLNRHDTYFYNDYGYYVTNNDLYLGSKLLHA